MTAGRTALLNDDVGVSKILPNDLQVLRASFAIHISAVLGEPRSAFAESHTRRSSEIQRAVRPADANAMHRNEFGKVLHPKTKMNE